MLCSPLFGQGVAESDQLTVAEVQLSSLLPTELRKVFYPDLVTVASLGLPPTPAGRSAACWGTLLRLSRQAMASHASRALLLDTQASICLYYPWETIAQDHAGEFPFPPPDDCLVMAAVRERGTASRRVPQIVVCRAGTPEAPYFEEGLVEDRMLPDSLGALGFGDFCSAIVAAAAEGPGS